MNEEDFVRFWKDAEATLQDKLLKTQKEMEKAKQSIKDNASS